MPDGKITDKDNEAIEIDGEIWYKLGPKVKASFIRLGECEYSIDPNDEETVSFVKMKKSGKPRTFGKNKSDSGEKSDNSFREPIEIIREGCLNVAKDILIANKEKEKITHKELVYLAQYLEGYVLSGELPKDK